MNLPEVFEHYVQTHPAASAVQESLRELARKQMALHSDDSPPSSRDRLDPVQRLLEARAKLIESQADEAQRCVWMADQASDLYFELLPIDASGVTTLFGLPDTEQRERARTVAARMVDLAQQAEQSVARAIVDLEAKPGGVEDADNARQRRHLVEIERARRIPFLRGIGAALFAELHLAPGAERDRMFDAAVKALEPLTPQIEGAAAVHAHLVAGLAQARLGQFDAAEEHFRQVSSHPAAAAIDIFSARMGGVVNRTMRHGPSAGLQALDSVAPHYQEDEWIFLRMLMTDQRFLLLRQTALAAEADQRGAALAQAFEAYTALMNAPLPPSMPRETLQAAVFDKLVVAAELDGLPLETLPPIVTVARAANLARDQTTREQAVLMLEQALAGGRLQDLDRAAGLFVLGQALYEHGELLLAARRLIELADQHPSHIFAERAIESGVTIATELHRRSLDDREARELLRDGLRVLLEKYPNLPSIDQWRYEAGRLALLDNRHDEGQALLLQVTPGSTRWFDAHYLQSAVAQARAEQVADPAQIQSLCAAWLAVIERVMPVIESGMEAAAGTTRADDLRFYRDMLRVHRGQAHLRAGRLREAIDAVADLDATRNVEPGVIAEALKVRMAAHHGLNKPDEAVKDIEAFMTSSPQQVGAVLGPMIEGLTREVQTLLDTGRDDEARMQAEHTLAPIAQLLANWLASRAEASSDVEHALALRLADAQRLVGQCEKAIETYTRLAEANPDALEILLGRAECLFALGGDQRLADAMAIYKRIGAMGPENARTQYWLAHLRMLQILDLVGRNTEQIAPRIERLRQQDPTFGGERFRRGFEQLLGKYR